MCKSLHHRLCNPNCPPPVALLLLLLSAITAKGISNHFGERFYCTGCLVPAFCLCRPFKFQRRYGGGSAGLGRTDNRMPTFILSRNFQVSLNVEFRRHGCLSLGKILFFLLPLPFQMGIYNKLGVFDII